MILFNSYNYLADLNLDGIFDYQAIMNAQLISAAYRYEDLQQGTLEARVSYARLSSSAPDEVINYYENNSTRADIGVFGKDLGVEVGVDYSMVYDTNLLIGAAAAYLFAGKARQVEKDKNPTNNILLRVYSVFNL